MDNLRSAPLLLRTLSRATRRIVGRGAGLSGRILSGFGPVLREKQLRFVARDLDNLPHAMVSQIDPVEERGKFSRKSDFHVEMKLEAATFVRATSVASFRLIIAGQERCCFLAKLRASPQTRLRFHHFTLSVCPVCIQV
jgi:hypothetical protein